ncbi:MAG: hypothetical protein LQ343_006030, partial [Gyalolechia ehrenbergii]
MAVNNPSELREALKLPANDTPKEYWEAVVECLREWGASNRDFGEYHWEGKLYPHARARIRKRFQSESSRDLDVRARGITNIILPLLHHLYDTHGREWILQRLPPHTRTIQEWILHYLSRQTSSVSDQNTIGHSKKTSTKWTYRALLALAISIFLGSISFVPTFNPLCTEHGKPLIPTCPPPTEEGAAFWHNVTKDFSIAQALIPTLSNQVIVNGGAIDHSDENGLHNAASNVQQASMGVAE